MIKEAPLVSVAIATFNQIEFLIEAIESVLMQDYTNIEIVIGDDGSTDGTHNVLKKYSKSYPGKFVLKLSNLNHGIAKNANEVHFACQGKYIAWLGGDDLMLPGKISTQVKYMEENPNCTICYHNLEVFQSETNEVLYYFNQKFKKNGDVKTQVKYGTFNGACSVMIKREKAPIHGFDVRLPIASDYLYWVETLVNGGTINYIDEVLGKYRRHNRNVTTTNSESARQGILDHYNSINIIIQKYPYLIRGALYRFAGLLFNERKNKKIYYLDFLLSSIRIKITKKAVAALVVYICSFGIIKL